MLRHPIDPLVDCVFKALLGDPAHADLLLSFLNAIARPDPPIRSVEILNPYSPAEFIGDDLRVVDVRARDEQGRQYQVEVQLVVRRWLPTRMLYTWADLYQSQLQRGDPFSKLQPQISIWVLAHDLLPRSPRWHHRFRMWDEEAGVLLSDHAVLHTVELQKWAPGETPLAPDESWVYFLKAGHGWKELPEDLRNPELEKAMRVLEQFSEKAEDYHRYQARMNWLREQATIEEERAETAAALAEARAELTETKSELTETKSELTETKSELTEAKSELTEAKSELSDTRSRLAAIEAELARLRAELSRS